MKRFAMIAAVGLALAGCDDTTARRAAAIEATRGTDAAQAAQGAAELEKILEKTPRDHLALYWLGHYYVVHGRPDDARWLYERLIATSPLSEEAEKAKDELAKAAAAKKAAAPPASASADAPLPPLAPTAIVPGKGITGVTLGMTREAVVKVLGACERELPADSPTTCLLPSKGMEVVYKDGKVASIGLYGEGRERITDPTTRYRFRGFTGQTPDGIELGMRADDAATKLGKPAGKRAPLSALMTREGAITMEIWDYPKLGLSLEIDATSRGQVVSGVQIPTVGGRPLPTAGGKP